MANGFRANGTRSFFMRILPAILVLVILAPAPLCARGPRIVPALDEIRAIESRAAQQHLAENFPVQWAELAAKLKHDREVLESLRGKRLTPELESSALEAIDDVERIDKASAELAATALK